MQNKRIPYTLLFALLGALFFIPYLGAVHLFDWDEINFAEISREMIVLEDYLRIHVNFLPFWEKPPFFFWTQVLAMKAFGINEFSARLPNAICGILTLTLLFQLGKRLYNTRFGVIWAGVYLGSILPHLYFRSGIIDPFFNLFIFLGLLGVIIFYWKKEGHQSLPFRQNKWLYLIMGGLLLGMGILTKGPVAYLIVGLTLFVYWIFKRFRFFISPLHFLVFSIAASLVTLAWYGLETWKHGPWFIAEFNKYQYRLFSTPDAGHKGFPGYHFVVLLVGCFPASIFTIRSFFRMPKAEKPFQQDFKLWMAILFWSVLILFSMVQSKIVHYSSMCYFPLTFLGTLVIHQLLEGNIKLNGWMKAGLGIIGGIFVLATALLPFIGPRLDDMALLLNDPFVMEILQAEVDWTGWESIPGLWMLASLTFFFYWWRKQQQWRALVTLFLGTAVFVTLTLYFYVNHIEAYSQRAAIEFFESKAGEDCYVLPVGYKSYGQLFYVKKQAVKNPKSYDQNWLLTGDIDKDVYFITKIHKKDRFKAYKDIFEIGQKNGFVFFKRAANSPFSEK